MEVDALNAELLRIADYSNFNKIALLDGTLDTSMQIGNTVLETLAIAIDGVETATPAFDTPTTRRASGTSDLDYLSSSAVTDPSDRWADPTSTTTGIPASSTASVTIASAINTRNFAGGVFNSGWNIVQSQIELGSSASVTAQIGGFATSTDSEPAGSVGDGNAGQIARGRIFDTDATSEASRLAKQQILAGAGSKMIALAATQKRGLIDMLI